MDNEYSAINQPHLSYPETLALIHRLGQEVLLKESGIYKKLSPIIIEQVDEGGAQWGVSFNGPNPIDIEYVAVKSQGDALKLCRIIKGLANEAL